MGIFQTLYEPGVNLQAQKHYGMFLTGIDEPEEYPNSGCTGPYFHGLPKEYRKRPGVLSKYDAASILTGTGRLGTNSVRFHELPVNFLVLNVPLPAKT